MPKLYPYIVTGGRLMRSDEAFINAQIAKAIAADLPETVVYERLAADGSGPTGEWVDISELADEIRDVLTSDVKHWFPDWISEQEMAELSDMKHQAQMADLEPDGGPGL
jgi:hypothetical protein